MKLPNILAEEKTLQTLTEQ